jgi:Alpha-tubulin suppressor and related RCC1 domain-containing proteins
VRVASSLNIVYTVNVYILELTDLFLSGDASISIHDIVCGPTATAIITSENTAYMFGGNKCGQLGQGHQNDVLIPTLLSPPDSTPLHSNQIDKIILGQNMSAIMDTSGELYTMGYNGSTMKEGVGCLGHGYFPEEYLTTPTLVKSLVEDGCKAQQVVVGNDHMTVLTDEGEVLVAGSGGYGRCGNLDPVDQLFLEPVELLESESDICQIAGGKDFSLALTKKDGIIFAWGRNHKGQCGTGSGLSVEMYAMEAMPVPIEGMLEGRKVVKIAAGHSHAVALTEQGELFVWGMGTIHQPELVTALGGTKVKDFVCGQDYTIIVDEQGQLRSFGKGKTGVLGLASEKFAAEPTLVEGMIGKKVVKLSAGWKHVACLAEEVET